MEGKPLSGGLVFDLVHNRLGCRHFLFVDKVFGLRLS